MIQFTLSLLPLGDYSFCIILRNFFVRFWLSWLTTTGGQFPPIRESGQSNRMQGSFAPSSLRHVMTEEIFLYVASEIFWIVVFFSDSNVFFTLVVRGNGSFSAFRCLSRSRSVASRPLRCFLVSGYTLTSIEKFNGVKHAGRQRCGLERRYKTQH